MAATLRDVLHTFEAQTGPVSLAKLAQQLDLSAAVLDDMIAFWVRKGRLRPADQDGSCSSCGVDECPFVMCLPRSYVVVEREFEAS